MFLTVVTHKERVTSNAGDKRPALPSDMALSSTLLNSWYLSDMCR